MINLIQPVILCGGSGSRLWPLSRSGFPKQFLCLTGDESLFQQAAKRLVALTGPQFAVAPPYIVSNEEHRFLALEQLREVGIDLGAALLEPCGRNTAPALTLAALAAREKGNDPVMIVTPADQTIADDAAFTRAMHQAIGQATEGAIAILGITPSRPETGYGYIKAETHSGEVFNVESFVEKPDMITAQRYFSEGGYFWNAGIFVLKASVWLSTLKICRPEIAECTRKAWEKRSIDVSFVRPGQAEFAVVPSESIDHAVMEQLSTASNTHPTSLLKMVPLDAGWNDLGAWDAVWQTLPKDENGNAHMGDVFSIDSSNTLVHTSSRLVSLVGVSDLIVVETSDAVLVVNKARSQEVKHIVSQLQATKREEHTSHRKVHRPWGWYDSIDKGDRFKVKRIQVKPGASLSLQKHHHRAEHWIVVKGTAEITNGNKVLLLTENQSTYIPLGEVHRLANPGSIPLEIIEVQSGGYLGEDDIVRLDDHYGRSDDPKN